MSVCPYATLSAVTLATQAEVDAAITCTTLGGSLTIGGPDSDIFNLDGLSNIQKIDKYLDVNDMPAYTNPMDIFPSLSIIEWGLSWRNTAVESIDGFHALTEIGDTIDFSSNPNVHTITGFESLHTVWGNVKLSSDDILTTIPQFESLEFIVSDLVISDNPSLAEITGFTALKFVDVSFQLVGNPNLSNLCGFHEYFTFSSGLYSGCCAFAIDHDKDGIDDTTMEDVLIAGPCGTTVINSNSPTTAPTTVMPTSSPTMAPSTSNAPSSSPSSSPTTLCTTDADCGDDYCPEKGPFKFTCQQCKAIGASCKHGYDKCCPGLECLGNGNNAVCEEIFFP